MRQNIKEPPEFKTYNLDESIVSEETVNSGYYSDAQKILQKFSATGDVLAEQFYRLGTRFFYVNQKQAAELAWEKAYNFSVNREVAKPSESVSLNLKRLRLQTVGSILIVAVSFYVIIFSFFEREPELFQFTKLRFSAGELSFWDEWWDTGRPVKHSLNRRFGAEELWPLLKQKFKNLFER